MDGVSVRLPMRQIDVNVSDGSPSASLKFSREADRRAEGVEAGIYFIHPAIRDVLKIEAERQPPVVRSAEANASVNQPVQIEILPLAAADVVTLAVHPAEASAARKKA